MNKPQIPEFAYSTRHKVLFCICGEEVCMAKLVLHYCQIDHSFVMQVWVQISHSAHRDPTNQ